MAILVADPDLDMRDILSYLLRRDGYGVSLARDGPSALATWQAQDPQLVLLEAKLPGLSGWEVCQRIRAASHTPIIFLTAVADEEAFIYGLDLGADDYITKPFSPRQLLARIRSVLRRSQVGLDGLRKGHETLRAGDLTLDPQFRTVMHHGDVITLTPTEFKLLYELVLHEGQVLTQHVLTDRVWGYAGVDSMSIVKGQVFNVRRKLEPDSTHPVYIHTIAGSGYVFRRPLGSVRLLGGRRYVDAARHADDEAAGD